MSAVLDRIRCVLGFLRGEAQLRHVGWRDCVSAVFGYYGRERRAMARRWREAALDEDYVWIEAGTFGLAWPVAGSRARLAATLAELWISSNPHYYHAGSSSDLTGATVLDVGACEGAFAVDCLLNRGASQVWCFEPDAQMAHALELTRARNGILQRLHVVQAVVGKRAGTACFRDNPSDPLASAVVTEDSAGTHGVRVVPMTSLDAWWEASGRPRVDLMKIDAEGSDLEVLQGARELLVTLRPRIAVTTYHAAGHCNAMVELLSELKAGYSLRARGIVTFGSVPRPVMLHAVAR